MNGANLMTLDDILTRPAHAVGLEVERLLIRTLGVDAKVKLGTKTSNLIVNAVDREVLAAIVGTLLDAPEGEDDPREWSE